LFTRLFKDLAATHASPYIHIGCDETHLLGHCPVCKKLAADTYTEIPQTAFESLMSVRADFFGRTRGGLRYTVGALEAPMSPASESAIR
jgi:hypothetical protein